MARFIGISNNRVSIISDNSFVCEGTQVIKVPSELENASNSDLISSKIINNKIRSKFIQKPIGQIKLALISNYATKCGIGTYSKFLYDELIDHVADYKLFIEKNDIFEVENPKISRDKIKACWKRGENLSELVSEINKYEPDIILIQHEFGLFPCARHWISLMTQLSDYRVIVTMHSVFHHADKTLAEACIPEIVVHLEGAKEVLKQEKNITGKVYVIPHGCFPCIDKSKLWNFYKSEHTFVQFGFLFRYKGYENSIKAVALLKQKYPDIFFTGLCSTNDFSKVEHEIYFNELLDLIHKLGVQENVGLIKGFQSENVLNSYLRSNKAAVFPYVTNKDHECFGSSGAAPYTMTKAIPVITSGSHHFKDLPTMKADTPEEISMSLDKLFSDNNLIMHQINLQNKYLEENSWKNVADMYMKIFENKF